MAQRRILLQPRAKPQQKPLTPRGREGQAPLHPEEECKIPRGRQGPRRTRTRTRTRSRTRTRTQTRRSRRCTLRIQKRERWKELTWETRLANHYLQIAKRKIELYKNEIMCLYGYCADGNLPTWKNQENYIGSMTPTEYLARPTNMACHNLCENNPMPQGTRRLLGLGLKYCTLRARPTNRINQTIEKTKQDVRRMAS